MAKSQGYKITTRDEAMQMIVSQAEDDVIVSSTGMDRLDKEESWQDHYYGNHVL